MGAVYEELLRRKRSYGVEDGQVLLATPPPGGLVWGAAHTRSAPPTPAQEKKSCAEPLLFRLSGGKRKNSGPAHTRGRPPCRPLCQPRDLRDRCLGGGRDTWPSVGGVEFRLKIRFRSMSMLIMCWAEIMKGVASDWFMMIFFWCCENVLFELYYR